MFVHSGIDKIDPLKGATLPYQVLREDLADGAKQGNRLQVRNGGYGSDMTAHPTKKDHFYALTDRGPNATYKNNKNYGRGKIFPTPDYTPRIGLFKVNKQGKVELVETILLKRPDGTAITGLPNHSDMGGTGETPYHVNGQPILLDDNKPFDAQANPIKLDNYGLDGEGLVAMADGSFWVSDEYGPHIVHFDKQGRELTRINAFENDRRSKIKLPAEFAKRRANRGMEGLAITPDEKLLIGTMQSTIYNPDKSVKNLDLVRLVTVDLQTGQTAQYLYQQEKNQNSNSGIAALSNQRFVVIERDGAFLRDKKDAMKRLYRIDISTATDLEKVKLIDGLQQDKQLGLLINGETLEQAVKNHGWQILEKYNIKPVQKKLVADVSKLVNYPHDKLEGMWLIDGKTIAVLNDDDFATWSKKGKLEQKYLDKDKKVIDSNTLYILKDLSLQPVESRYLN